MNNKENREQKRPWGAYVYSFFGDLACIWWAYLFVVMIHNLLYVGAGIAALSYYLYIVLLGPITLIYSVVGFVIAHKAEKGKEILFISALVTLLFLILPYLIYLIVSMCIV